MKKWILLSALIVIFIAGYGAFKIVANYANAEERMQAWANHPGLALGVGETQQLWGRFTPEVSAGLVAVVLDESIAATTSPLIKEGASITAKAGATEIRALSPGETELLILSWPFYLTSPRDAAEGVAGTSPGMRAGFIKQFYQQWLEEKAEAKGGEFSPHNNPDTETMWRAMLLDRAVFRIPVKVNP